MRVLLAISLLVTAVLVVPALRAEEEETGAAGQAVFPAAWVGRWRGPALHRRPASPDRAFSMELRIAPLESRDGFTWTIYFSASPSPSDITADDLARPYELHPIDASNGHWRIDEKNTVLMDAFHVGEALHSRFEVGESVVDARYAMRDGAIEVLLTTFGSSPLTTSGSEGDVPSVASFELRTVQSARLERVEGE